MRISDWSSDVCSSDLRKAASALNRPPVEVVRRSHKADAKHGEADLAEIAVRNADARRHKADSGAAHRCGKQPVVAQITAPQRPGGQDDRTAKADLMEQRTYRTSVVAGKRVSVRVDSGGSRNIKNT